MRQEYRLEALNLQHIGPFEDMKIHFKPRPNNDNKAEVHIFTGPNGCGKSTILYAIAGIFAESIDETPLQSRIMDQSRCRYRFNLEEESDGEIGQNPSQDFSFAKVYEDIVNGKAELWQDVIISNISQYKKRHNNIAPSSPSNRDTLAFAVFAYSGNRSLEDTRINYVQPINCSPFENALSFSKTIRPQVLMQWIANNRTQSALAKAENDRSAAEKYDRALQRISDLIFEISETRIEFKLIREPLSVVISVNNTTIGFDGLPDGLKSIISWVADLTLRLEAIPWASAAAPFEQPIILLLDEIDIHLHPKWQRRVLPAVQKLLPNAQIFVSTHSPFVIGSVEDAWVYPLPESGSQNGPYEVEGISSGAGKSYRLILAEVFGLDGEFDITTEKLFLDFYEERKRFLEQKDSPDALLRLAEQLSQRGEETQQIIGRELRQLHRLSGKELRLA